MRQLNLKVNAFIWQQRWEEGQEEEMKLLELLLVTGYPTIPIRARLGLLFLFWTALVLTHGVSTQKRSLAPFQTDSRKQSALRGFTAPITHNTTPKSSLILRNPPLTRTCCYCCHLASPAQGIGECCMCQAAIPPFFATWFHLIARSRHAKGFRCRHPAAWADFD